MQTQKTNFQLRIVLWQSIEPDVSKMLKSFKICFFFGKNAEDIFANYIESLRYNSKSNFSQTNQQLYGLTYDKS